MSLTIPLTVALSTSRGQHHVAADVRDLMFRWTDPGGYAWCRIALDRPLAVQPDEIAYYGGLTVYDARNGMTVWDGRQEDPGRSAGDGQVWDLAAVGGHAHTRDRTVPLAYVDSSLQSWVRVDNVTAGGTDGVTTDPGDSAGIRQAVVLRIPQGTAVAPGSKVQVRNETFARAGQKISRLSFVWDVGLTAASLSVEAIVSTAGVGGGTTVTSTTWNTAGGTSTDVVVTDWTAASNRDRADLRMIYTGTAGNVSADTWWLSLYSIALRALLVDKAGVEVTTGYTLDTVYAHEVVADLLGRLLTQYDGANATIATTTHGIDHLMYPDGVDAARVLADLMALESGHTWRVWERSSSSGRYRFEWVARETSVRYEADVTEGGYDSQGSADGLYNSVLVRWRDQAGEVRTTTVTGSAPALTAAGLPRQGQIDLGDEVGSSAAATRAGQQWLAERAYPANAGRLRIARPILDIQTGRMVMPWEIRPGLIRVRGILPRPDALNATARDGVTVFRIVGAEYRASDAAAVLDLDSTPATVPNLLAEVLSRPVTRRR